MTKITKPFQWYGGKGRMLNKLMSLVPEGGLPYAEPYAGSAALFFARKPALVEVLNDLDGRIVNFYRVMQSEAGFRELKHRLQWTPYSRAEFAKALDILKDLSAPDVDRAWAFFVAANQSISGIVKDKSSWGLVIKYVTNGMADTVSKWVIRVGLLDQFRDRLIRAQIDQRDALEFIQYWDNFDSVFYVDPPYHHDTRKDRNKYAFEPSDLHHCELVSILLKCKGAVVLSGYAHEVYKPLEDDGWIRRDFKTACYAVPRTRSSNLQRTGSALKNASRIESVWINPRAAKMTAQDQARTLLDIHHEA